MFLPKNIRTTQEVEVFPVKKKQQKVGFIDQYGGLTRPNGLVKIELTLSPETMKVIMSSVIKKREQLGRTTVKDKIS